MCQNHQESIKDNLGSRVARKTLQDSRFEPFKLKIIGGKRAAEQREGNVATKHRHMNPSESENAKSENSSPRIPVLDLGNDRPDMRNSTSDKMAIDGKHVNNEENQVLNHKQMGHFENQDCKIGNVEPFITKIGFTGNPGQLFERAK